MIKESYIGQENGFSELELKILSQLNDKPGSKARDISSSIGIDKKSINNALYGNLFSRCVQDEEYNWYLKENAPKQEVKSNKTVPTTILTKLCKYYLSCLGQDDEGGISVFADSKYDLDYVELDSIPLEGNTNFFYNNDVQKIFGKKRKDRGRNEIYFGYPVTIKRVKSKKSNWEGSFVEPIIMFPIEIDNGQTRINQNFPIFNLPVIKRFTNAEREQLMDELMVLEEELNLLAVEELPELDDLVRKLFLIRPEWPWKEKIDPDELNINDSLRNLTEEGIYNKAVLIIGERSPFTQGLESELKSLSEIDINKYKDTILGKWINNEITDIEILNSPPLLEVLPINSEQRLSIQNSLDKPLTIITGPPGTGKSQVVTNLLINAAWRGKKVLFASKNNKAVDVVETRVNNLGTRPILLRMGSGEYHTKLAEYLIGLLSSRSTDYELEEFENEKKYYKNLENSFSELEQEELKLIRIRNETDQLNNSLEHFRKSISDESFLILKNIDINDFTLLLNSFDLALNRAIKSKQSFFVKLFWFGIKENRIIKLEKDFSKLKQFLTKLELPCFATNVSYENINELTHCSKKLNEYLHYTKLIKDYFSSLKKLQTVKSLEQISKDKLKVMNKLAENAERLWKSWLMLQPNNFSSKDRSLLSNYNTLLKMVIEAGSEIYSKLGKKIYREYSDLSKKVSHLLPAWAITSLSAKGRIPFEAGYFDIIVFDEASQCDIASALPLLYRAKQAVIIGDPKQLRHISGLSKFQDHQLLDKYDLIPNYAKWAYSYNSLFDLASGLASNNDIINLRDHHRSHSDIIEFSNSEFYEGKLRVATNYDKLNLIKSEKNGVRWVDIEGKTTKPSSGGAMNVPEAQKIIDEIESIVFTKGYKGTIGVVTPFRAQANLIRNLISKNEKLHSTLINHNFLVDTVHKFQGDERDVMFFSPVVSKGISSGAMSYLKHNGNLFNVAITRARSMLIVVGDLTATMNCSITYLENFARYTQNLEYRSQKRIENEIKNLDSKYPKVSHPERVSVWEHIFYEAIYKAGIKVLPQYQVEKYTLDFALFNNDRMLNIEIDGERYHRNWTGELCRRDQIRNQRLYELGWDVKRFWVYEVRDDLDNCIEKIKAWIEN